MAKSPSVLNTVGMAEQQVPSSSGSTPKLRVLVVDDHQPVLDAVASLLSARGFDTTAVNSGQKALECLRGGYFDVMLADVLMPEMSGLDLLSQALEMDRDLPVLMLTAVTDMGTTRAALERGAMDYLTKPIEMDALAEAVTSAANHRRHELKRRSGPHAAVGGGPVAETEFPLKGGPLDGRKVRMDNTRLKLWLVVGDEGEEGVVQEHAPTNLPAGSRTLGSYAFSQQDGALCWSPA